MRKKDHIHRLKKHKYKNGEVIFFCTKDDCSFRINADLSWGKTSECWRCSEPFQMTNESKRQDKPHCENCTGFRSEASLRKHEEKKRKKLKEQEVVNPIQKIKVAKVINSPQDLRSRLDRLTNSTRDSSLMPSEKYPDEDML